MWNIEMIQWHTLKVSIVLITVCRRVDLSAGLGALKAAIK